eukprot:TRINITY_DN19687_c0_g1_i2.p1 TRINITY_DN19687_c0_g1~~TRINITY_DN19687_c0_g1_i2.p1  ORF type:complete len:329 (+),score=59.15 TRINITY_DN19687_c0_g1_i2:361-1347(+)
MPEGCPNMESAFLMDLFGVARETIPILGDIPELSSKKFVLIDFNDIHKAPPPGMFENFPKLQTDKGEWGDNVVGIIDHHAPQAMSAKRPLMTLLEPWGSACTIMATKFHDEGVTPARGVAGVMLGGILSDTLGLKGPTTRSVDKSAVEWLSSLVYDGTNLLESVGFNSYWDMTVRQFEAKSTLDLKNLAGVFAYDMKRYPAGPCQYIAIGSVEVAGDIYDELLELKPEEVKEAMRQIRPAKKVDYVFVAIIDVLNFRSKILTDSEIARDAALEGLKQEACASPAQGHYDTQKEGEHTTYLIDSGSCVSRKTTFQPALISGVEKVKPCD